MKGVPQGKYTKEFREEAVKLVVEGGMSLPKAARSLFLPPSMLGNWVRAHKQAGGDRIKPAAINRNRDETFPDKARVG